MITFSIIAGIVIYWYIYKIRKQRNDLLEALKEIAKGEGRYDMDQLKHASNTVEDMKNLALTAIKKLAK